MRQKQYEEGKGNCARAHAHTSRLSEFCVEQIFDELEGCQAVVGATFAPTVP